MLADGLTGWFRFRQVLLQVVATVKSNIFVLLGMKLANFVCFFRFPTPQQVSECKTKLRGVYPIGSEGLERKKSWDQFVLSQQTVLKKVYASLHKSMQACIDSSKVGCRLSRTGVRTLTGRESDQTSYQTFVFGESLPSNADSSFSKNLCKLA